MANDVEEMVDQQMFQEDRDALLKIMDALAPLSREAQIKVLTCVRTFFGLPRSE